MFTACFEGDRAKDLSPRVGPIISHRVADTVFVVIPARVGRGSKVVGVTDRDRIGGNITGIQITHGLDTEAEDLDTNAIG